MGKIYQKPGMNIHAVSMEEKICLGSRVTQTSTNLTGADAITLKGAGNVNARAKRRGIWDDVDEGYWLVEE